jgi:transposase-like protein
MKHNNKVTKEEKAKVVLAILRGDQTANEIASQYGIHPALISRWKQTVIDNLPELFEDKRQRVDRNQYNEKEEKIARLERLVGQRDYELDWLKKKLSIFDNIPKAGPGRPRRT